MPLLGRYVENFISHLNIIYCCLVNLWKSNHLSKSNSCWCFGMQSHQRYYAFFILIAFLILWLINHCRLIYWFYFSRTFFSVLLILSSGVLASIFLDKFWSLLLFFFGSQMFSATNVPVVRYFFHPSSHYWLFLFSSYLRCTMKSSKL